MSLSSLPPDIDDVDWRARAALVIPGGASSGSKRPAALYGDAPANLPTHFVRAEGCHLYTPDNTELVDCTMALGAVAIGYADELVVHAVTDAVARGNVAGLSSVLEVRVAERLSEAIPCAEQVRFLKGGAEGVAAAVRVARAHTGRSLVLGCGYFGWLDWWNEGPGIPAGAHADFRAIPFDDVAALDRAVMEARAALAAIVLEPVIERLPSTEWIEAARQACDAHGAVLIFDEMKTGFRLRTGGYQEYSGIMPDLAVFGKAMANGFPLSAIVGREAVMQAFDRTWVSATLAGEAAALAACDAVLDWHAQAEVCEGLWATGEEMMQAVERAVGASAITGVRVRGIAPMWLIEFDEASEQSRFLALGIENGVLFKRGAYCYASLSHDENDIARIEDAASDALVTIRDERHDR